MSNREDVQECIDDVLGRMEEPLTKGETIVQCVIPLLEVLGWHYEGNFLRPCSDPVNNSVDIDASYAGSDVSGLAVKVLPYPEDLSQPPSPSEELCAVRLGHRHLVHTNGYRWITYDCWNMESFRILDLTLDQTDPDGVVALGLLDFYSVDGASLQNYGFEVGIRCVLQRGGASVSAVEDLLHRAERDFGIPREYTSLLIRKAAGYFHEGDPDIRSKLYQVIGDRAYDYESESDFSEEFGVRSEDCLDFIKANINAVSDVGLIVDYSQLS